MGNASRREFLGATAGALLAARGAPKALAGEAGMEKLSRRPNLLYIPADQLRLQSCGYAGDARAITPCIDRLASQGVNFSNAISSTPVCAAYRASLFTGIFIFIDYLVTMTLCKAPLEEGNLFARSFMEIYGIPVGLTLFDLLANVPIYIVLCLNSHLINLPPKLANIAETAADIIFAWFIAGLHFNGATSWFWFAPDVLRQSLGASLYFLIVLVVLWKKHV
jgi:hypothetical protein